MSQIKLTINGKKVSGGTGQTILDVARKNGIKIPHLCNDRRIQPVGECRMCLGEVEGQRNPVTACTFEISDGMALKTDTDQIHRLRKTILELLFYEHRGSCATCDSMGECKLQRYAYEYQISEDVIKAAETSQISENYTTGNKAIEYDPGKCIRCSRCIRICNEVQMAEALTLKGRASDVTVTTAFDIPLNDSTCVLCGQCISACPTGALYEREAKGKGQCKELVKVRTTCPYCGVGCQLDLNVNPNTNRVVRVTSKKGCIPNDGNMCVKGRFGFQYIHSEKRLTTPLIRENGEFRRANWEDAIGLVGKELSEIRDNSGPDSIPFLS